MKTKWLSRRIFSTKDIASEEAVDITMTANYADRCAQLIKNLAESACKLKL
ncbi:MAG: hypothetical protein Q7J35_16350 [Candidatus Methanoperedens sp.]|nr:hypothetical protein [Candidatus Methanoperedens sp.]